MVITRLSGLGCGGNRDCDCQSNMPDAETREVLASNYRSALYGRGSIPMLRGLGEVKDYDVIKIGGTQYSVNQIVGKTVVASKDTKIYFGTRTTSQLITTVKAGQPIGVVYSYIKPTQSSDGNSWLQFDGVTGSSTGFGFARNENVSESELKDSGALTVEQELKKEADEKLKAENPALYYAKKIALPAAIVVGVIIIGKAAVTAYINKPKPSQASSAATMPLSGVPGRKKRKQK